MVEEGKIDDRRNFMKRMFSHDSNLIIASYGDPLKKREEFAVSLRK